jgi:hypothetical protein
VFGRATVEKYVVYGSTAAVTGCLGRCRLLCDKAAVVRDMKRRVYYENGNEVLDGRPKMGGIS